MLVVMGGNMGIGMVSLFVELEVVGEIKIMNTSSGDVGKGFIVDNDVGDVIQYY